MMERIKTLSRLREREPLIHCITNAVTVNDCANILLAAGARPTMAHHPAEVKEVTGGCDALVCNLGATGDYEAMLVAAEEASRLGHPIIADPVGAGGSSFRREMARELLQRAQISCIRGNASEMRAVFLDASTVTGVDAGRSEQADSAELTELARRFSRTHGCVCVISGRRDIVTDGSRVYLVNNGHEWMTRITGSGCMSTVLLGAFFAAVNDEENCAGLRAQAAAEAMAAMGICGERAAELCEKEHSGTMSFKLHMMDEMSRLSQETLEKFAAYDLV